MVFILVPGQAKCGFAEFFFFASRTAFSSSAFLTLDGVPIKATCYNIDGNNYFKLRDITDALDCRVECDDNNQLIWVVPSVPAYDDPNEAVG